MSHAVFTIGLADRSMEQLLALLHTHRVNCVADVRWPPYSASRPQFDRDAVDVALHFRRIQYLFLGKELGPFATSSGRTRSGANATTAAFQQGVKRIQGELLHGRRVALLGTEKDPLACHRGIFIAPHLISLGIAVRHIVDEELVADHHDLQQRVLDSLSNGLSEPVVR
ncbi:MAG TPA: DUF488 domain-containing protein [Candidatus Koribacter sp.]